MMITMLTLMIMTTVIFIRAKLNSNAHAHILCDRSLVGDLVRDLVADSVKDLVHDLVRD